MVYEGEKWVDESFRMRLGRKEGKGRKEEDVLISIKHNTSMGKFPSQIPRSQGALVGVTSRNCAFVLFA
jgi:hypothetical protein